MKKRKQFSPTLGNVAVTPAENKSGWQSREEFYAAERAAEKARAEAPIIAAQSEMEGSLRKLNKHIAEAWSQPIPELIAALQRNDASAEDTLLPVEKGRCTREAARKAAQKWDEEFAASPYALSEAGQQRLTLFGLYAIATGYKMDTTTSWQSAFDRLRELNAFGDELTFDQSKVVEPVAQPVLSERDQIEVDMLNEMYPLAKEWADSLRRNFNYVITERDREIIFGTDSKSAYPEKRGLFYVLNLNPLQHESYSRIRRYLCDRGIWDSEKMLTKDEKFSRAIESETTPLSHLTGESRQTLVSSLNLLRQR